MTEIYPVIRRVCRRRVLEKPVASPRSVIHMGNKVSSQDQYHSMRKSDDATAAEIMMAAQRKTGRWKPVGSLQGARLIDRGAEGSFAVRLIDGRRHVHSRRGRPLAFSGYGPKLLGRLFIGCNQGGAQLIGRLVEG